MKYLLLLILLSPLVSYSQNYILSSNFAGDSTSRRYVQNSPSNSPGNRREVQIDKDSVLTTNMFLNIRNFYFGSSRNNGSITGGLAWWDANGNLQRSPVASLPFDNRYASAADTFPSGKLMTTNGAMNAIGSLASDINGKADKNTMLTINGVGFNLNTDRSWTVAPTLSQITSALGYTPYNATNPSGYISSVPAQAWSTITGKPTTLSGYGISDAYPLSGNPSNFLTSVPAQSFSSITSKPTTLSGYGITDAYPLSGNPSGFLTGIGSLTTTNLSEGSNLYYTSARFNTAFSGKTTTDLSEGANLYFTNSRARASISLTTTGTSGAASYNNSTGVLNIPNYTTVIPTYNASVTRPINATTYTISTTQSARVYYTIRIACTATIGSSSSGLVFFEYSLNGGSTWIPGAEVQNSNTVTLAVVLNSATIQTGVIACEVPANALCRMSTTSSGTTTVTYVRGNEILY